MMRKFAVALIATTMLVAPALAADAVKSTPASPVAASTTTAPITTSAPSTKTLKAAHRYQVRHVAFAKTGKHPSHVKTAKVSKPVKSTATAATPVASTWTLFPAPATDKSVKTIKVSHRHVMHDRTVAKNFKPKSHVKTAKVAKPVKAATAIPASVTTTPAASTDAKPAVKTIKASKGIKKIEAAHRNGHHVTAAKNFKHVSHVKTAKVSKPVNHANPSKAHRQVANVVKSSKLFAN